MMLVAVSCAPASVEAVDLEDTDYIDMRSEVDKNIIESKDSIKPGKYFVDDLQDPHDLDYNTGDILKIKENSKPKDRVKDKVDIEVGSEIKEEQKEKKGLLRKILEVIGDIAYYTIWFVFEVLAEILV
eukprot:TRINITY_DN4612_c0_g1_i3.p1 TRINITY_DN4612_c0_g1~~TRINITY_DN4612_c0_g1_i3.p1  ORF type:complete len:128 (+),score=32.87 TRINITY_DN4612_c0_g1_i3:305-688(+)